MYVLTGFDKNGEKVTLDDKIPDDFAATHTATECGEFYPNYRDFELTRIEEKDE